MNPPVRFHVEMPASPRNRLTAFARPLLAIPHVLLVGGPLLGILHTGYYGTGVLRVLAWLIAIFDWFAILIGPGPVQGLQGFKRLYLNWRAHVLAYTGFLRDEYPPFGYGAYPAVLELSIDPIKHDKALVLLRPFLVLPHLLVLAVLLIGWTLAAFVSWILLSLSGSMPDWLWRFSRDVSAYSLRVEAYALLVHDEFPPFELRQGEAGPTPAPPRTSAPPG